MTALDDLDSLTRTMAADLRPHLATLPASEASGCGRGAELGASRMGQLWWERHRRALRLRRQRSLRAYARRWAFANTLAL